MTATYRHRNTKNSWAAPELIHTFWVGQRVARSWERRDYIDMIGQAGTVTALPEGRGSLTIRLDSGETATWSATECIPLRKLHEGNRKRFIAVAKTIANHLRSLDENGETRA